jgi:hypothetical protein
MQKEQTEELRPQLLRFFADVNEQYPCLDESLRQDVEDLRLLYEGGL